MRVRISVIIIRVRIRRVGIRITRVKVPPYRNSMNKVATRPLSRFVI